MAFDSFAEINANCLMFHIPVFKLVVKSRNMVQLLFSANNSILLEMIRFMKLRCTNLFFFYIEKRLLEHRRFVFCISLRLFIIYEWKQSIIFKCTWVRLFNCCIQFVSKLFYGWVHWCKEKSNSFWHSHLLI